MRSPRVPDALIPGRRPPAPPAGAEPSRSSRELLMHTWPGRLFIISAGLKIVVALLRLWATCPAW
jgi:hypothetical protein